VAGTQELRRYADYDQEEETQEETPGPDLDEAIDRVLQHFGLVERLRNQYKGNPAKAIEMANKLRDKLGMDISFYRSYGCYTALVIKPPTTLFPKNYIASLALSEERYVRFTRWARTS